MAAGLGFKTFTTGEVLTAGDTNGYLMQGVLVFADAAARSAAITSPQEGQFSYLKDSNSTWYYSGSAWVAVGGSPLTTKGDLYGFSTTDARVPIGTNAQVLTADSTAALGLKWATPASGSMTLLASGNLTSTSVTISSISGSYKNLVGFIKNPFCNIGDDLIIRVNGVTSNVYNWAIVNTSTASVIAQAAFIGQIRFVSSVNLPVTSQGTFASFNIFDYANSTTVKNISTTYASPDTPIAAMGSSQYGQTTAITAVTITTDAGTSTFSGGTYEIYGVN